MKISNTGAWSELEPGDHTTDNGLSAALCEFFKGQTVIDLGCGSGDYVKEMRAAGIIACGVDGNPDTSKITNGMCAHHDLTTPLLDQRHNWALSLEVAEHIPQRYEAMYLDNVDRCNERGVVISWAAPGQTGHGHVNERYPHYVADDFERMGYEIDIESSDKLRQSVTSCEWIARTLLVFRRKS